MYRRTLLPLLLLAPMLVLGCGQPDCQRSVVIELSYAGSRSGVIYWRETVVPTGTLLGAAGGGPPVQGPTSPSVVSTSCWESASATDLRDYAFEAWMDTDGDDQQPCFDTRLAGPACGPDPGEPHVVQEYTALAKGRTNGSVVLTD